MKTQICLLSVLLGIASQLGSQQRGTSSVSGQVLTEAGEPFFDVSVYLEPVDRVGPRRPTPVKTDQQGRYIIDSVAPGQYVIHAFKTEAGYPDIIFAFNTPPNYKAQRVTVTADLQLTNIEVHLGPKAGTLNIRVVDAATDDLIANVTYKLCQLRNPTWCVNDMSSGETEFSVPPVEITVEVSSKGYQKSSLLDGDKGYFVIGSGGQRSLRVALKPDGQNH